MVSMLINAQIASQSDHALSQVRLSHKQNKQLTDDKD